MQLGTQKGLRIYFCKRSIYETLSNLLIIPYTRREAVSSSRIEGTQASLAELFYYAASSENPSRPDDLAEIKNYIAALDHGLAQLERLPLSLRIVRELHEHLMRGARGADQTPGEFRKIQNWIGRPGSSLASARYVPPPPGEELANCLKAWEAFLNIRNEFPTLFQCALIHSQFEAIHPFRDGNGRVGRLLITLFLCERKALRYPLLYLSAFFERHHSDYYDLLLGVCRDGDWNSWLKFFMRGVISQSNHALESAKRIIDLREQYRAELQSQKTPANGLILLDFIFTNPYLTIQQAALHLGAHFNTAKSAIGEMTRLGILEEITGRQRNRLYVARKLLHLLAENEPFFPPDKE